MVKHTQFVGNLLTNCLSGSSHFVGLAIKGLNTLTKNYYTVKDSFHFDEEICEQDPSLSMRSLDVNSLFTNIPPDETIDISINQLFENTDTVERFTKSEFKQPLCLEILCSRYFCFFKSNDHLNYFQEFLNSYHINMPCSMETEKLNKFSFLDVEVTREHGKFTTTIYRKTTFSVVYSNFESSLGSVYKFSLCFAFAQI